MQAREERGVDLMADLIAQLTFTTWCCVPAAVAISIACAASLRAAHFYRQLADIKADGAERV